MEIIGVIVGVIIGLLGKFVAPGDKDNIPIWLTVLCGIGAASSSAGSSTPRSVATVVRALTGSAGYVAIVCAAVLVVIASTLTGRNRSRAH